MSNTSVKVAIALLMILTAPAASFARGGHGGGHAGFGAMGGFARPAGSGAMGNVPISGIARGPANAGGNEQCGGRSQRRGQRFQDSSASAAAHSCADNSPVQLMRRVFAKP